MRQFGDLGDVPLIPIDDATLESLGVTGPGYDPETGILVLASGQAVHVGTPQAATSQGPSTIPYSVPQPGPSYSGNTVSSTPGPAGLPPGPAPRVSVPLSNSSFGLFLQSSTLISGVPNLVVLGGGLAGLLLLGSIMGGKGRRR